MTPADLQATVAHMGTLARAASRTLAASPVAARNDALRALARRLRDGAGELESINARDVAAARDAGLAAPLVDRLKLDRATIATVAEGCEQIAAMADPIGAIVDLREQPSGIRVGRMRVPIGVFAMIYESRPNVTIEAASLAIKSGNACILRGGSEALALNVALGRMRAGRARRSRPAARCGAARRDRRPRRRRPPDRLAGIRSTSSSRAAARA